MGMAASQARLLSITAEMHNVELLAQKLQSQKIALATEEDQVYQAYCDAMDATKITVTYRDTDGSNYSVDANYSTICGYNDERVRQYALVNNRNGLAIVSEDIKNRYEQFGKDKYSFAWACIGLDANFNWTDGYSSTIESGIEIGIGNAQGNFDAEESDGTFSLYMSEVERMIFERHPNDTELQPLYDALLRSETDGSTKAERQELLDKFRNKLYSKFGAELFELMNVNKQCEYNPDNPEYDFPEMTWNSIKSEFNYYTQIWDLIHSCGGCETVDPEFETGDRGTEWFNNMVKSGLVSIHMFDENKTNVWTETSVATNIGNNYLQEEQDEKLVKKAEAEYEHQMSIINKKDTRYDTELKKLETKENSLKTMLQELKTTIKDNTERTFNLFS